MHNRHNGNQPAYAVNDIRRHGGSALSTAGRGKRRWYSPACRLSESGIVAHHQYTLLVDGRAAFTRIDDDVTRFSVVVDNRRITGGCVPENRHHTRNFPYLFRARGWQICRPDRLPALTRFPLSFKRCWASAMAAWCVQQEILGRRLVFVRKDASFRSTGQNRKYPSGQPGSFTVRSAPESHESRVCGVPATSEQEAALHAVVLPGVADSSIPCNPQECLFGGCCLFKKGAFVKGHIERGRICLAVD